MTAYDDLPVKKKLKLLEEQVILIAIEADRRLTALDTRLRKLEKGE